LIDFLVLFNQVFGVLTPFLQLAQQPVETVKAVEAVEVVNPVSVSEQSMSVELVSANDHKARKLVVVNDAGGTTRVQLRLASSDVLALHDNNSSTGMCSSNDINNSHQNEDNEEVDVDEEEEGQQHGDVDGGRRRRRRTPSSAQPSKRRIVNGFLSMEEVLRLKPLREQEHRRLLFSSSSSSSTDREQGQHHEEVVVTWEHVLFAAQSCCLEQFDGHGSGQQGMGFVSAHPLLPALPLTKEVLERVQHRLTRLFGCVEVAGVSKEVPSILSSSSIKDRNNDRKSHKKFSDALFG
jgi:hypothetical protein